MLRRRSKAILVPNKLELTVCRYCKKSVRSTPNPEVWIDYNGGNSCGFQGGNHQHKPEERR